MSKREFERMFETPESCGSASQASFLERTTVAMLACGAVASTVAVICTIIEGSRIGIL